MMPEEARIIKALKRCMSTTNVHCKSVHASDGSSDGIMRELDAVTGDRESTSLLRVLGDDGGGRYVVVTGGVVKLYQECDYITLAEMQGLSRIFTTYASRKDAKGAPVMTDEDFKACVNMSSPLPKSYDTIAVEQTKSGEEATDTSTPKSSSMDRGSNDMATTNDTSLYSAIFGIADRRKRHYLSFSDFIHFENMLRKPNAEFELAFRLFDGDDDGYISIKAFKEMLNHRYTSCTLAHVPFTTDTEWFRCYVGRHEERMDYTVFSQLLAGLPLERLRQEFRYYDPEGKGCITLEQCRCIIADVCPPSLAIHLPDDASDQISGDSRLTTPVSSASDGMTARQEQEEPGQLTPFLEEHLSSLLKVFHPLTHVTYAQVLALRNVLRQHEVMGRILRHAWESKNAAQVGDLDEVAVPLPLCKADFMRSARQVYPRLVITPLEVDILFHFADLCRGGEASEASTTPLTLAHFHPLLQSTFTIMATTQTRRDGLAMDAMRASSPEADSVAVPTSSFLRVLESTYRFMIGAVAGAIGATVVYPIDLVKTRLQNQRSAIPGELLYKNSMDCFRKVVRNEGILGLYRGLGPQLVGVAPEKAIKLTMNDLMRNFLKDGDGNLTIGQEMIAGGVAGGSQVIFTNPLEIVKIRLQVQGEAIKAGAPRQGAWSIVRQLGLIGLYKGAGACLLRDIPFSAIYFPAYANIKRSVFGERPGYSLTALELLSAGAMAGMPAAYLSTPADVIKTRLQVEAKAGQATYTGIMDAFRKILAQEGPTAFFKGGPARVFRSSPQFGVTLVSYELIQRAFPFPFGPKKASPSATSTGDAAASTGNMTPSPSAQPSIPPELRWKYRQAARMLQDVTYKFSIPLATTTAPKEK